jgi:hypothetical protein
MRKSRDKATTVSNAIKAMEKQKEYEERTNRKRQWEEAHRREKLNLRIRDGRWG